MFKKKTYLLFFFFIFLFALSGCSKRGANVYQKVKRENTITWGVKADTPLFGSLSVKDNKLHGFDIDLARALTKEMLGKKGKAKFVVTTPNTKIPLLKNGNIDAAIAAMTITPQRKKQVDFTQPYFPAGQSLLVKKGSPIKSAYQLNGKKVLVVKGTTAGQAILKFSPHARVLQYDDYGQAMSALKAGQGDVFTTDNGILAGILKNNPGYQLVGGTFTNQPYGIAVNKGQSQMLHKLNHALNVLRKNGTYKRLLKKWFTGIPGLKIKE